MCTSPTFEDYLQNAWISVSGVVILVHAYFLAGHNITNKSMKYLENSNYHDLLLCPSMIFRLYNDLSSSKVPTFIFLVIKGIPLIKMISRNFTT